MIANESTTSSLEGPIQCPHARGEVDDLVVQEIYDELVVYDLRRHKVHSLNATASLIWRWCDGQTLPEQVAQRLTGQLGIPPGSGRVVSLARPRPARAG
ncbi:MAG: PqqD family protein [Anaerolineales bacterium]|nr:PqqD family protein [Anaerolineales bacterium]